MESLLKALGGKDVPAALAEAVHDTTGERLFGRRDLFPGGQMSKVPFVASVLTLRFPISVLEAGHDDPDGVLDAIEEAEAAGIALRPLTAIWTNVSSGATSGMPSTSESTRWVDLAENRLQK